MKKILLYSFMWLLFSARSCNNSVRYKISSNVNKRCVGNDGITFDSFDKVQMCCQLQGSVWLPIPNPTNSACPTQLAKNSWDNLYQYVSIAQTNYKKNLCSLLKLLPQSSSQSLATSFPSCIGFDNSRLGDGAVATANTGGPLNNGINVTGLGQGNPIGYTEGLSNTQNNSGNFNQNTSGAGSMPFKAQSSGSNGTTGIAGSGNAQLDSSNGNPQANDISTRLNEGQSKALSENVTSVASSAIYSSNAAAQAGNTKGKDWTWSFSQGGGAAGALENAEASSHQDASLMGQSAGGGVLLSEDPENYFSLILPQENIFEKVHSRYVKLEKEGLKK